MLAYHPAAAVSLTALPMLVVFVLFARLFDAGEDYEHYRDQIEVTETELAFGLSGTNATVAVIGKIKNLSPVAWKDISLHATFSDAAAKTIDVGQRHEYSYYLPPNDVLPFKVSFRREFPESNYVNHAVRVIGAKDARARF